MLFFSVDTNVSWKALDINKEDITKTVKQLVDTVFGLLVIADSDRDSNKHEYTMRLLQEVYKSLEDA